MGMTTLWTFKKQQGILLAPPGIGNNDRALLEHGICQAVNQELQTDKGQTARDHLELPL